MSSFDDIPADLQQREAAGLYRRRRTVDSAMGRELGVDGRRLLNFCSNDYLGLAADQRVSDALVAATREWGAGSGASHLVCGHTRAHHELEEALADFTGRPRALLFSSGYAANVGTINALVGRGDYVFEDKLNHASLLDGGLLSGARFKRYRHRDTEDIDKCLGDAGAGRKLVVSDGTFSMDGTVCDVTTTGAVARRHGAWFMLDEAHSLGVTGPGGRGLARAESISASDVPVVIGTLGKAFGTQGGFAAGSEELIETLIQHARTYIYSTAIPAAVAAATLTSLQLAHTENWRRERLQELITRFRDGAAQLGIGLAESHSPIQPVLLGDERSALAASAALEELGLLITAIRPPTVPAGTSRLRITLTAAHRDEDVDRLLDALRQVIGTSADRASA